MKKQKMQLWLSNRRSKTLTLGAVCLVVQRQINSVAVDAALLLYIFFCYSHVKQEKASNHKAFNNWTDLKQWNAKWLFIMCRDYCYQMRIALSECYWVILSDVLV